MSTSYATGPRDGPGRGTVAACYDRVSTIVQGQDGFSLSAQATDAAALANREGWVLPAHLRFIDGGSVRASGVAWNLTALNAMLNAARARQFSVLIVHSPDRLARTVAKALVIEEELRFCGISVVFSEFLLRGPAASDYPAESLFGMAERERETIKLRTGRGRREKAAQGLYVGNGTAPYGYKYVRHGPRNRAVGLAVVETEAVVIRELFQQARSSSMAAVLRWLDSSGCASPGHTRGRKNSRSAWTHNTLYSVLRNPLYAGRAQWAGIEIPVPAIIEPGAFEEVQRALARRKTQPTGWTASQAESGDPYLLRGRLICGPRSARGELKVLRTEAMAGRNRRYYICANKFESRIDRTELLGERRCPLPSLRAELVEEYLWSLLSGARTMRGLLSDGWKDSVNWEGFIDSQQPERGDAIRRTRYRQFEHLERISSLISLLEESDPMLGVTS